MSCGPVQGCRSFQVGPRLQAAGPSDIEGSPHKSFVIHFPRLQFSSSFHCRVQRILIPKPQPHPDSVSSRPPEELLATPQHDIFTSSTQCSTICDSPCLAQCKSRYPTSPPSVAFLRTLELGVLLCPFAGCSAPGTNSAHLAQFVAWTERAAECGGGNGATFLLYLAPTEFPPAPA